MNAQSPQPPQGAPKPQQQQPQQKAEPDKAAGPEAGSGPEQPQSDVIGGTAADPLGEEALPGAAAAASRIYRSTVSSHGSGTLISSGSVHTMNFYGGQPAERLLAAPSPRTNCADCAGSSRNRRTTTSTASSCATDGFWSCSADPAPAVRTPPCPCWTT